MFTNVFCSDHLKKWGGAFVFECVLVFLFLFYAHKQLPQIIIGIGRVIYQIEAFSVLIRTKFLKKIQKFSQYREKLV